MSKVRQVVMVGDYGGIDGSGGTLITVVRHSDHGDTPAGAASMGAMLSLPARLVAVHATKSPLPPLPLEMGNALPGPWLVAVGAASE